MWKSAEQEMKDRNLLDRSQAGQAPNSMAVRQKAVNPVYPSPHPDGLIVKHIVERAEKERLSGTKHDDGKVDYTYLEPEFMEGIARVFMFGAGKYGRHNYKAGMQWSRVFSALMRHMWKWWRGEMLDPETGESHLFHAGCCLAMLVYYEQHKVGEDNRYVKPQV